MPGPFSTKGCDSNGRWSRQPDGFSYLWPVQNAYQFVPVGQSRSLSIKTDHRPWTLTAVDLTMSGGIDIRINARKTMIGPFQTYALEPGIKYPLDLTGKAEATQALVMSTPGEAETPLLYVHAGGALTVHYAVNVILRDCSQTLQGYSKSELLNLLLLWRPIVDLDDEERCGILGCHALRLAQGALDLGVGHCTPI